MALVNISATSSTFFGKVKTKETINGSRKLSDSQKQVDTARYGKSDSVGDGENEEWKMQSENRHIYSKENLTN